jgi:hypothetical protein
MSSEVKEVRPRKRGDDAEADRDDETVAAREVRD